MSEMIYYDLKQGASLAPSLSSQVAREIGRRIVSSNYPAGELIEDEATLAARYRVSRSVIRDAVKILAGKGLLEVRRGIGTRVRSRDSWGVFDDDVLAWTQSAPPDPNTLWKLLEFRQTIEPKAARWAAERGSLQSHATIESALLGMEENIGTGERFVRADAEFHRAILRSTENEFLTALEGIIFSALLSSIRITNSDPKNSIPSMPAHRTVYEAIARRDADGAEQAMTGLLQDTERYLSKRLAKATMNMS